MSFPILYKASETNFTHLGLGVLNDCISGFILEERNGKFELELEYPSTSERFKELKNDRMLKVDASHELKDQLFRIIRITKPAKGVSTVYAEHISYLTEGMQLLPSVPFKGDASKALETWSDSMVTPHPFTVFTDIKSNSSGEWKAHEIASARLALGGAKGSMLDRYSGEYRFDNYHIELLENRGRDNGVLIAYGKNLIDLEQDEAIANTYTSVYPFSVISNEDDEDEEETVITLPEYFIDSEYVDKYARRRILKVDFSEDEITTVEALRKRTNQYIKASKVGVPKVNIRAKYIDLSKSLDHKNLALIEQVNLCDYVTVYFEKLDIYVKAKVIKTQWNFLLDRYDEIEIGQVRASLSDSLETIIDEKMTNVDTQLNVVKMTANGKTRIFRSTDEPQVGMSANDLWYKPIGQGENLVYGYDGYDWQLEKMSVELLQGQLDIANSNIDLINIDVDKLTGDKPRFVGDAWNEINSNASINESEFKFDHSDGSYTAMNASGLNHVAGDSSNPYHSKSHFTSVNLGSTEVHWVQLPGDFKGKSFTAHVVLLDSMTSNQAITRIVSKLHPEHAIDYDNARVPLLGYRQLSDGTVGEIQALLIATY